MFSKTFFIAGVQHHQMNEVLGELGLGDELELVQEPTNKFDPNAIKIIYEGTMLGYVPKKFSAEVSAAFETDELLCTISKLDKTAKPWEQCEVNIIGISEEDNFPEYKDDDNSLWPEGEEEEE